MAQAKSVRLKEKIAALREQMQQFRAMEEMVRAAPDQQVSLTDPDARSMATSGKGTGVVGYNVQTGEALRSPRSNHSPNGTPTGQSLYQSRATAQVVVPAISKPSGTRSVCAVR